MKPTLLAVAFFSTLLVASDSCGRSSDPQPNRPRTSLPGYDLSKPMSSFQLPAELKEISGLTDIDDHTIACVQDERGRVFYVDLRSGRMSKSLKFGGKGDYEGLTRVGDALWVLRSDGLLLELVPKGDTLALGRRVEITADHRDFEGLAYDPFRKVILVAPKDPPSGSRKARAQRRVFAVDPASGQQLDSLALWTSVERIILEAERAGIPLPERTNKKGKIKTVLKARFSSIAVHPLTGHFYIASAIDSALLVLDREGHLCATHLFDDRELPKLEGISFLKNGDLIISSEGVDSPARIQVFRYVESAESTGDGVVSCEPSAPVGEAPGGNSMRVSPRS